MVLGHIFYSCDGGHEAQVPLAQRDQEKQKVAPVLAPSQGGPRKALPITEQKTFQQGFVDAARFDPLRHTIIYGAAWKGAPIKVFNNLPTSQPDGEERPSDLPPRTSILAVSSTGELALSRKRRPAPDIDTSVGLGVLTLLKPGVDEPLYMVE